MKTTSTKNLHFKKKAVAKLTNEAANNLKGGTSQPKATDAMCNSVPPADGGIGCHLF